MNTIKFEKFLSNLILIIIFLPVCANARNLDSLNIAVDKLFKNYRINSSETIIESDYFRGESIKINQLLSSARKFQNSNYDSILFYTDKAINLSLKLNDPEQVSSSIEMLGSYYVRVEDYNNAGSCYLLSLKIEDKIQNKKRIAGLNHELGTIYLFKEMFPKSFFYLSEALAEYESEDDTLNRAKVLSHLGNLLSAREYCEKRTPEQKKEDFAKAIEFFQNSILLSRQVKYESMEINGYLNIASVYNKLDQPEQALTYLANAEKYFRKTNDVDGLTSTLHTKGITYSKLKKYNLSIKNFEESLKIGKENKSLDGVQFLYESMAETYSANKDYKNALTYYIKFITVSDSVNKVQNSKELNELETKYQTEKKQNEIIKLTAQKHEKNQLLYSLSGLILILCFLGYFIMKNARNKKLIAEQNLEIKEQHILELEKERQLIATKSVLKGEESERSRMARDLHDGLGGLLSGVKINLSSMKGNSIISSENAEIFNQAIKLLDNSIIELRRVAHSLMPETLNHFGLKTAFNDFIADLGTNAVHTLTFRFSGQDIRYNSQLELTIYRIAQELVNNALKHSGAKNINLQLIAETNRVCIQVVDDGKGFISSLNAANGKGLVSIRERVASANGRFDLESTPGHGTEATVEFMV